MKVFKFPTVHRPARLHEDAVEVFGSRWVVGEKALTHKRGCYYVRDVDELVEYYPLYLLEVKRRVGDFSKAVVSLPLDVYVQEKVKREMGRENLIDALKRNCSVTAKVGVEVVPQGIAGLQHLIEEGKVETAPTLLIDGGFNTVNVAVVNEELGVDFYKTFTDEIGVRNLIENYFAEELKLRFSGLTTNLVVLKEVFLKEKLDDGLVVHDVRPEKEKALENFLPETFRKVSREVKRAGVEYEQVVIIGGLSHYLKAEDFETNRKVFVPERDGEFLNVLGLLDFVPDVKLAVDLGFGDCKVAVGGKSDD